MGGPVMPRSLIAVVGDTRIKRGSEKWKVAWELGKRLTDEGYLIVTGGLGDLPKALAEGARSSSRYREGCLIALLPDSTLGLREQKLTSR